LYGHGGAYNHGAEAIVKTTIKIIREKYSDAYVAVSSHFPEQDKEFAIDADEFFERKQGDGSSALQRKAVGTVPLLSQFAREMYSDALDFITPDTVCLSVGGDNFSYPNWHRWAAFQQQAAQKKAKTILWGCSIEPSMITPEMSVVLESYAHILARETHTFNALNNSGIKTDIRLIPDPAFLLTPEPLKIPEIIQTGDIIGINISPLIIRREPIPGIIIKNITNLIDYILTKTDLKIALIPHVLMPMDNDYDLLHELEQSIPIQYRSRVWLAGEKLSAAELKYIILKCRLIICARTHTAISAYSSGVPALVLGYSVKSAGIAEDLGVGEFVLNVADLTSPDDVREMFIRLNTKTDEQRTILAQNLKDYTQRTKDYMTYI